MIQIGKIPNNNNGWLEEDDDEDPEEDEVDEDDEEDPEEDDDEDPEEDEVDEDDEEDPEEDDDEDPEEDEVGDGEEEEMEIDNKIDNPEADDQQVREAIEAVIRAERERVRIEATRAGSPGSLARGPTAAPVARECSFAGFMKCGPTQFHGTKGAVGLCHWFEKMENTFEISECAEGRKVSTLGREVANGRPWNEVKHMMIDEFCLIEEVQRLEDELRHLKLRDMNIAAYTERFNELALLCPDAIPNEEKKVELYIKGLPEIIKGETTSSRPATLNEAVRMAHALIEQKIQAKNERIAEGIKRK
ncbi:putative reverse transcriptase domain-containing protein [Tanacetum coccineum]